MNKVIIVTGASSGIGKATAMQLIKEGHSVYGPIEEVSYEQAKQQFEVNLFGLAEVTKAVLPAMRSQKSGTIVNLSSIGGKVYGPLAAWYHATKFGLEGWSERFLCLILFMLSFTILNE